MKSKFYAVVRGRKPGLYLSWDDAFKQVQGFSNAMHKCFKSEQDASSFLRRHNIDVAAPARAAAAAPAGGAAGAVKPHPFFSKLAGGQAAAAAKARQEDEAAAQYLGAIMPDSVLTEEVRQKLERVKARIREETNPLRLWSDGGARGNPGVAGAGGILKLNDGQPLLTFGVYLGDRATNNEAEYVSLIGGLRWAEKLGARGVHCKMDSKLVVNQVRGRWQVKAKHLRCYKDEAASLLRAFGTAELAHVLRGENFEADACANAAMDTRASFVTVIADEGDSNGAEGGNPPPPAAAGPQEVIAVDSDSDAEAPPPAEVSPPSSSAGAPSPSPAPKRGLSTAAAAAASGDAKRPRPAVHPIFLPRAARAAKGAAGAAGAAKAAGAAGAAGSLEARLALCRADAEQRKAVEYALNGDNMLLTGVAGTGKSFVVNTVIDALRARGREVGVVAPTGIAAANVGGQTIHSLYGLSVENTVAQFSNVWRHERKEKWRKLDVLIVDEASMMSGEMVDRMDEHVPRVRGRRSGDDVIPGEWPQVIMVGDFLQLPPVENSLSSEAEGRRKGRHYPYGARGFCFESDFFWSHAFRVVELRRVYRQEDKEFVAHLAEVRKGRVSAATRAFFEQCRRPLGAVAGVEPTEVYTTNRSVDALNQSRLKALRTGRLDFKAVDSVHPASEDAEGLDLYFAQSGRERSRREMQLRQDPFFSAQRRSTSCKVPAVVELRVGAQVMLLWNLSVSEGLCNGTRGVVVGVQKAEPPEGEGAGAEPLPGLPGQEERDAEALRAFKQQGNNYLPKVRFVVAGGKVREVLVKPVPFEKEVFGVGSMRRLQLPLGLAWAITTHKSQGQTLTRAKIDISNCFAEGQAYVALSRASGVDGLELVGELSEANVRANATALAFYSIVDAASEEGNGHRMPPARPEALIGHWRDKPIMLKTGGEFYPDSVA